MKTTPFSLTTFKFDMKENFFVSSAHFLGSFPISNGLFSKSKSVSFFNSYR